MNRNLHKFFLRLMLASLALTAILGVVVVLFQWEKSGMRALSTAFTTTVASALMAGLAAVHNHEQTKRAGLFGMIVVVVTYILVLPLIWWRPEERIAEEIYTGMAQMAIWIFLVGGAAFLCLLMMLVKELRQASYVALGLCLVAFLQLVLGTWLPDPEFPERFALQDERWFWAALATAVFGTLAVAGIPRIRSRYWPALGILAAVVGWSAATYVIFWESHQNVSETIITISSSIAALVAYINLILFLPLLIRSEWVRTIAIGTVFLMGIGVDFLIIHNIWDWPEYPWHDWVERITAAASIVASCSTVGLLVLAIIQRFSNLEGKRSAFQELTLTCPRCETQQTVEIGKSMCSHCQLEFFIQVHENQKDTGQESTPNAAHREKIAASSNR